MLTIFDDAKRKPELCCWFGSIPAPEIEAWVLRSELLLPADLLDFWCAAGGGDIFDSETILRPAVQQTPNSCFVAGDDTDTQNLTHRNAGMPASLFVFHVGTFLSAIALESQRYVTLRDDYSVESEFASFDDWYSRTLRAEFGTRYGLDVRVCGSKL